MKKIKLLTIIPTLALVVPTIATTTSCNKNKAAEYVSLTVDAAGGVYPGESKIIIKNGTTWADIKSKIYYPYFEEENNFFDHWTVNGQEITDLYKFDSNQTIKANYVECVSLTLNAGTGKFSISDTSTITTTFIPKGTKWSDAKYYFYDPIGTTAFDHWELDGQTIPEDHEINSAEEYTAVYKSTGTTETTKLQLKLDGGKIGEKTEVEYTIPKNTYWCQIKYFIPSPVKESDEFDFWSRYGTQEPISDVFCFTTSSDFLTAHYYETVSLILNAGDGKLPFGDKTYTLTIAKGTKWGETIEELGYALKDMVPNPIIDTTGLCFDCWVLGSSSKPIDDNHSFDYNDTIYARYKRDTTEKVSVTINSGTGGKFYIGGVEKTTYTTQIEKGTKWSALKGYMPEVIPTETAKPFSEWQIGGQSIEPDHKFEGNETITAAYTQASFENDPWSTVITYANQGLDALKTHYGLQTFVGLERKIKINNINGEKIEHRVRVIGENHDDLANGTGKAALTFELANVVTISNDGTTLRCRRRKSSSGEKISNDYVKSTIRANLEKSKYPESSLPDIEWKNESYKESTKDMYTFLNEGDSILAAGIKEVTKQSFNSTEGGVKPYSSWLFLLTDTEMAQNHEEGTPAEGKAYKYWTDHNTDAARIKKPITETRSQRYPMASSNAYFDSYCFGVDEEGKISYKYSSTITASFSFAFCI